MADDLEQVRLIERLKNRLDALEKNEKERAEHVRQLSLEVAELRGKTDTMLPQHQTNIERLFTLFDEREETAKLYYGESSMTAQAVETLKDAVDKLATKEAVTNVYIWVKAGFVAISVAGLLWVIAVFFKLFAAGVPTP